MSLSGLLSLLLAIVATLLLALYLMQRRELRGVGEINRQIDDALAGAGGEPARVYLQTDEPELQQLAQGVNRLLVQRADSPPTVPDSSALFRELADRSYEVVLVHRDVILFANQHFAHLLGVDRDALNGRALPDLVAPEFTDFVAATLIRRLEDERAPERFEVEMVGFQAQISRLELSVRRIDYEGEPALLVTGVEIVQTTQVKALNEPSYAQQGVGTGLFETLEAAAPAQTLALESLSEAILTTDALGAIDYLNPAAEQLLGTDSTRAKGKALGMVVATVDEANRRALIDPVTQSLTSGVPINYSRRPVVVARPSGEERTIEVSSSPMRSSDGDIVGAVVLLHDITELRGATRQLSYQATHDALTGLVNRREFERRLDEALTTARRGDGMHVLCFLDLDRFKPVNDTGGHLAGDALLRDIARLLRARVRDSDTVARIGGDEFALLLAGCPLDKARQIADDVCRAVSEHRFVWKDRVYQIGVSIGVLELSRDSSSVEEALAAADSACYLAKKQGSGQVSVYSARDEASARSSGEIQWLQRLQTALRDNRFELNTQPIIPVSAAIHGGPAMEVLVRLQDEKGRDIAPSEFLKAAERYRLMGEIDRWVIQNTFNAIVSQALDVPPGRSVSINISGQTLGDTQFLEFVVDCFDRSGVAPAQICFEMTESAVVSNIDHARRFVGVLHGMGCRFALDDFGSGVGSFSNLRNLPLDYLKIDGSFMRNLARDSVDQAMVAAMIKLARTLNFQIIAEQVEDNAALAMARELGVDFVQGFVIAHPQRLRLVA